MMTYLIGVLFVNKVTSVVTWEIINVFFTVLKKIKSEFNNERLE